MQQFGASVVVVIAAVAVAVTRAVPAPQGRFDVLNNTTMGSTRN